MPNLATITSKRQLTLPKEVFDLLELDRARKVFITTEENSLIVKPIKAEVEKLAGSLSYLSQGKKRLSFSKIREETKKRVAKKIAQEGL